MSSRWKMNRIGFVNFWLYDEEIFTFEDGKLLLRGQNGSGKSITTQSFIPFILDGDRTPSRLDPFGSSDRRMAYYFLGDSEPEEATGYLFLEFKKEESGQYRTIGIGQRAKQGAPMTFWGFVLTDGRRIGYDVNLYKEVGSSKFPYSKQDLKKILGPEVPFTDAPGEYKAMVNRYIFGFRRMEQYEQFIRLLIQVRAPKLSKEFKPLKVYGILNESLQTLTDEELRAMVDAMEQMDAIQNSLEHQKAAYKDAQVIQKEYIRYNQFMLGRKARAYLDSNERAENLKGELDALEKDALSFENEEKEKREVFEQASQRKLMVDAELDSLEETDLTTATRRLQEKKDEEKKLQKEKTYWERKAEESREHLAETDRRRREHESAAEYCRSEAAGYREALCEQQEILQFTLHGRVEQKIKQEEATGFDEISREIREWKQKLTQGVNVLKEQQELERQYDMAAAESACCLAQTVRREAELETLSECEEQARDAWIEACYALPSRNQELLPERTLLEEIETAVLAYQSIGDESAIRRKWDQCASDRRKELQRLQNEKQQEQKQLFTGKREKQEELKALRMQKDWEPKRSEERIRSREQLTKAGISWTPFYQAVEFAPDLSENGRNLLEGQLKEAGVLDALIVAHRDWKRVQTEFPEYADLMLCTTEAENGRPFEKLLPSADLSPELKEETGAVLRAISSDGTGLVLYENGFFKNGILEGRSLGKEDASLIGFMTRKRRLESQITVLLREIELLGEQEGKVQEEISILSGRMETLERELACIPDGEELNGVLDRKRNCQWHLERENEALEKARQIEDSLRGKKEQCLQKVIRMGKELPYARTLEAYQEAEEAAGEYLDLWTDVCSRLHSLNHEKELIESEREKCEQYEENQDTAIGEVQKNKKALEICIATICRTEEFLNRPENRELAKRLTDLRTEKAGLEERLQEVRERLAVIGTRKEQTAEKIEKKKADLALEIIQETNLRGYFEEELGLGLVVERGTKTLKECAGEAWGCLREGDRNREAGALVDSLYQVYHKYSGNLLGYGTSMEDCFADGASDGLALRKRQQLFSIWNGQKVYFPQFCQLLKNSIEVTELLILEKDREIFVDILSRTLSQQLTERIEESRQWIHTMSVLMKQMDTSMGLSFSLEWKARTAQNEQEIDTLELEKLLRRDQSLLTSEDIERVARHFRSKIQKEKQRLAEEGGSVNYIDMVRDALDYRKWFEFQMFYYRNQEGRKPLTNAAFNKFSGGEKAMAIYVPLFAAVNAQYQKSSKTDFPRMMALDEAFAGVDDKNISSMFQLVETLDFDYIMNSQAIWGCYETVPALRISELYRPADAKTVTVIHYTWNGHERVLDEQ